MAAGIPVNVAAHTISQVHIEYLCVHLRIVCAKACADADTLHLLVCTHLLAVVMLLQLPADSTCQSVLVKYTHSSTA
jgi:hypothetical protein